MPILREVLPALDLPQIESVWVELIGSRSLHTEDDQADPTPVPQELQFYSPLGNVEKDFNPVSSSKKSLTTTLSSLQHYSPASPLQPMTYVNQHQNQNQNENNLVSVSIKSNSNILSTKDSIEESTRLSENSVRTILTDVTFTVNPFQLHPVSFISPGKYSSSGFYSRNTQETKKILISDGQVYPTRSPTIKKYSVDQTTANVRSD